MSDQTPSTTGSARGRIRSGPLSCQELTTLLDTIFGQHAYWLCTSPEAAEIGQVGVEKMPSQLITTWPEGRLFSADIEVRWKQLGDDRYRVWMLGEQALQVPSGIVLSPIGNGWRVGETAPAIYLWGQFKEEMNHWVEVRVPRLLSYPIDASGRYDSAFAGIGHVDYVAPNGAVQYSRLTQIVVIGDEQQ